MPDRYPGYALRALAALWLLSCAVCTPAGAADAAASAADTMARERASLQAERQRLDAQLAADLAECTTRFAVTACQDDARERHRAAMAGPRARSLALDDAERRARAQARRELVAQKQQRLASPAASAAEWQTRHLGAAAPASAASAAKAAPGS